mgnify:CR=1 FL=1
MVFPNEKSWSVFLCQAEDGIRDLVRSRGLGDVYKRQMELYAPLVEKIKTGASQSAKGAVPAQLVADCVAPVSYTHLTLPTSDLV